MVWALHVGNLLYIPLWQEAVLRVSVDRVGHVFVGLEAEEVHKSVGGQARIRNRQVGCKWLCCRCSPWVVFSYHLLHKGQEVATKVHADCWLPAVWFALFKGASGVTHRGQIYEFCKCEQANLGEVRHLGHWIILNGDDDAVVIPETSHDTRDTGEKGLGPPLE